MKVMPQTYEELAREIHTDYARALDSAYEEEAPFYSAPSASAVQLAWTVLSRSMGFVPDRIVASCEGSVVLCWVGSGKYADIECFNDGGVLDAISDRAKLVDVQRVGVEGAPVTEQQIDASIARIKQFIRP